MNLARDVCRCRTIACTPLLQGMGNELRAIVHPQMCRCWVELEQILDRVNHLESPATSTYTDRQADAAVFIDHVQEFEHAPIHHLVELEVDRPDVVGVTKDVL